ncbi:alpha/beta fold hydrolase [Paraburkholderia unamae]|uniref:Microsomal epoxide hydrolase n=1 Tax=Paraburkholderia unamae TaxID=219649 RepID=A0ABX5KC95_9BURK|nr:alpha/beta hydrolase [Paraburkholderia unamae]PVX71421.1 microsomal epoxide hydrolase [Paraburkholderia unamae]CAG9274995.1 Microsomal epoxide hydrolase [Paraburkholderia unamae]
MSTTSRIVDHGPVSLPDAALPCFEHRFATVEGTRLHYVTGGKTDGETVVLLAGYPQSGYAWRKVMALIGERYRVIAPDLPGQGDSDRPQGGYDTLSLATALHTLLGKLDARRYHLAAHDVGAWVAYPYAALFGDEVQRLALLDAGIPGITLPDALPVAPERAWRTWHFAFHAIADLPELLIAGKERAYLDWFLRRKTANPQSFSEADIDEYLRVFTKEGGLRAGLAYYRAADLSARQNRELSARGKLRMPVLALSADQGSIPDMAAPLRAYANDVRGVTIAHCGHFLPEEQPGAVAEALQSFFG